MRYSNKIESDLGVCAVLKCPHCHAENPFLLHKEANAITFCGIHLFEVGQIYQLRCTLCEYRKDIHDREIFPAARAVKLYAKFKSGALNATDHALALEKLDFASLNELLAAAKTWSCPSCAEEVPANFSECWKCKAPRPNLKDSIPAEPFAAPRLHPDLTRPSNPWD